MVLVLQAASECQHQRMLQTLESGGYFSDRHVTDLLIVDGDQSVANSESIAWTNGIVNHFMDSDHAVARVDERRAEIHLQSVFGQGDRVFFHYAVGIDTCRMSFVEEGCNKSKM